MMNETELKRKFIQLLLLLSIPINATSFDLSVVRVAKVPAKALYVTQPEGEENRLFVVNQKGLIHIIENGEVIGLLNLEKEITGDIVQGLPKIEEILEARKKNLSIKRVPTNQKRGLLVQKTTLDPNFEFRKLGSTIKENDKVNPHNLLKVYFKS